MKHHSNVVLLLAAVCLGWLCASSPAQDLNAKFPESWYFEPESVAPMRTLEGERAPEISGVEWEGPAQSLHALRGRVVVLDLWAAWCPPCLVALTNDVDLVRRLGNKGVTLVAVHDGSPFGRLRWEKAKKDAADRGATFPLGVDAQQEEKSVMKRYKARFFPAYVVIDREGIVRAAGVQPDFVEKVVQQLLASSPAVASAPEFPPELYVGEEKRLSRYLALEGKPSTALDAGAWFGSPVNTTSGAITVVQFLSSTNTKTIQAIRALARSRDDFAKLNATIVGVAPPRDDWSTITALATGESWGISIAHDSLRDKTDALGRIALAMGASIHGPCYVIDAKGVVRAAGVKPERALDIVRHVAAHPEKTRMSSVPPAPKPTEVEAKPGAEHGRVGTAAADKAKP